MSPTDDRLVTLAMPDTKAERHVLRSFDAEEIYSIFDSYNKDADDHEIVFSNAATGEDLTDDVSDMAGESSDRARPRHATSADLRLDSFTIGIRHNGFGDRLVSMLTMGIVPSGDTAEIEITMIFTDAEFRGEGYGNLMADLACRIIDRAAEDWIKLPSARGGYPVGYSITATPVSRGGYDLVERIRDHCLAVLATIPPAGEPAAAEEAEEEPMVGM